MRLEMGRRADYAVRAMVDLARHHGDHERRRARDIAAEMEIPTSFVPQIMAALAGVGLVTSTPGPGGGYSLARPPGAITLREVIVAVDGPLESTECVLRGGPCRWDDACAVHVPWSRAQQAMLDQLEATTFADIAELDAALEAGTLDLQAARRRIEPDAS